MASRPHKPPARDGGFPAELRRLFVKAKMPTNPALATEILRLAEDSRASAHDFAEVIRADPGVDRNVHDIHVSATVQ